MATEDDNLAEEIGEGFGGSLLSKLLFGLSWFILLPLLTCPFWRVQDYAPDGTLVSSRWPWKVVLGCAIVWFCTAYCSFRIAKRGKKGRKDVIR